MTLDNTQAALKRDLALMVAEGIVSCVQCGGTFPVHETGCVREREDIDRTTGLTAPDGSPWD